MRAWGVGERLGEDDLASVFDARSAGGAVALWVQGVVKDIRRGRGGAEAWEAGTAAALAGL